jgi:hypothetical protein
MPGTMNRIAVGKSIEELWMAGAMKAHPGEEVWERYALGRLEEPELGKAEEHLLVCAECQAALEEATEYVAVMRAAARRVEAADPAPRAKRKWFVWNWLPMPALAGACAVLLAVLLWAPWRGTAPGTPGEWRTVELETLRGGEGAAGGARAGYALALRLDATGLAPEGLTGQIVAADGVEIAAGPVTWSAGTAELRHATGLQPGQYWVRLKRNGETIREYSLPVGQP